MRYFKKFLVLFLFLVFSFNMNIFASDSDIVEDDDRGLFSNDESTQEPEKEKKRVWDRFFEIGFDVNAGVSNNYFAISDILREEIVINMDKLNRGIGNSGLAFNENTNVDFFMNINTSIFKASFFADFEVKMNAFIGKGLFDFLANGNELDKEFVIGFGLGASVIEENSFSLEIPFDKIKVKAVPSYYVPLLYVPYTNLNVATVIKSDGTISAHGQTSAAAYSSLPINNLDSLSTDAILNALGKGGVDISLYGEYKLLSNLDVGAFLAQIPLAPAKLSCGYKYSANIDFSMDGILSLLSNDKESDLFNLDYNLSDNEAAENDIIRFVRPFKIGINANWRVFDSNILIISPMIQLKFADFTLRNSLGFGFDYSVTAKSYLGPLVPSFTSSYVNSIFAQQLTIALNLRVIELDFVVSTQSRNFFRSFAGSGLGVGIGFRLGI